MANKNYTVNWADVSEDTVYSVNNKTTLIFNDKKLADLTFSIQDKCLVCKTADKTIKLSNYSGIKYVKTNESDTDILTTTNIISASKVDNNENVITKIKNKKVSGTKYNDTIKVDNYIIKDSMGNEKYDSNKKFKGLSISSSSGIDTIYATKYKDTIAAGAGDDFIYSSLGNDTITGGTGTNTITYIGEFDTDTIVLTKKEHLVLDFSNLPDLNEGLTEYKISGNNLKITLYDSNKTLGTVVLKNFKKSNVVTSAGNIKLIFSESNVIEDLNGFDKLSFDSTYFSKKGTFTGTRFSETIDAKGIDKPYDKKNKGVTINAGSGYNTIYSTLNYNDKITGGNNGNKITLFNGTKTVTTGKGTDTVYIEGTGKKTLKTGAGDDFINVNSAANSYIYANSGSNTININNSAPFGNVYIYEENVNAINNITFSDELGKDFYLFKNKNDLILSDNKSMLTLVNYYKTYKKKSTYNFTVDGNDMTIYDIANSTKGFVINGKGIINGDEYNNYIVANDSKETVKASNDTILPGKGTDYINAGKGINNIYFYEGDGNDIILDGGGIDTIIFEKDTSVRTITEGNDLVVYYGTKSDSIRIKDYSSDSSSVKYIQVGGKKSKIDQFYKELQPGQRASGIEINENTTTKLILKDTFSCKDYTYKVKSLSGNQYVSFRYTETGRLIITGDHLEIIAGDAQADDIILMGSNNIVRTNDCDDIVRVGHVIDSNEKYYIQADANTIYTGDGNDYVTFNGLGNDIYTGDGDDKVLLSKPYDKAVQNEDDEKTKISFYIKDDSKEDDLNTCYIYGSEETRIFGRKTDTLDGQVGWYNQGNIGGDCRLFAILDSLSRSTGFNSLYDYFDIQSSDDENYTITLKNYKDGTYSATVSLAEIYGTEDEPKDFEFYVVGDLDVVLIDYAMNKILAGYGTTVQEVDYKDLSELIFGNRKITRSNFDDADFNQRLSEIFNLYKEGSINNVSIGIRTSIDEADIGIITGHAYALKDFDDKTITLINPWDNADQLTLTREKFSVVDPCVIVYGEDIYNENLILSNSPIDANTSFDLDNLNNDITGWLTTSNQDIITEELGTDYDNLASLILPPATDFNNNLT